jgi:predicted transcriptional regulator
MIPFSKFKKITSPLPLREQYIQGLIFTPGQIVTDGKEIFEILEQGPTYVTVRDNNGALSKKFITNIQLSESKLGNDGLFKGYKLKSNLSSQILESILKTVVAYKTGEVTDSIAVIRAIKALDEGRTSDAYASLKRIGQTHNHYYLKEVQEEMNEQIKVATTIAQSFGGEYCESPSKTIETVLESLIHIKHDSAKEAALKVIDLAEDAQIKINEKFFSKAFKSVKRGIQGWGGVQDKPSEIIKRNKSYSDSDTKKIAGEEEFENRYMKSVGPDHKPNPHSPRGLQQRVLDREMKKRGLTNESFIQNGDNVSVNKKYSTSYGKVLNNHGSVIEVKHNNGKVSFHPPATVKKYDVSSKPTPEQKTQLNTIATLGKKDAVGNKNTDASASHDMAIKNTLLGNI